MDRGPGRAMSLETPTGGATGARVGERQAGQRRMQASTGHEDGREGALRSAAALKAACMVI